MFGHIEAFWDIQSIKQLDYKKDFHKDTELINQYFQSGHSLDHMCLYNFFDTDTALPETTQQIRSLFPGLSCISVAINKFKPGQYLPLHTDLYQRYRMIHNLTTQQHIRRIVIMIEDCVPGQISQYGRTAWGDWRAGDWFDWIDEFPHAAYNFSPVDRYTWQVTGVID
jgi:hypothetical protein